MIIWPARLAEKYVTVEERRNILAKVNELAQTDQWFTALSYVIGELVRELNGEEQGKVDTGTLSLVVAVGLAVLLTMLITCEFFFF
uniref:Transmembrane protein n=1 Tax=Heterorhabditis bacteriophora TaxID=37862 RepID=A0A1I7WQY3_HETBA